MNPIDTRLTFGEYLHRLRKQRRLGLQQLGAAVGRSASHLSRVESGAVAPTPETVVKLAQALDGDLAELLTRSRCLPAEILALLGGER